MFRPAAAKAAVRRGRGRGAPKAAPKVAAGAGQRRRRPAASPAAAKAAAKVAARESPEQRKARFERGEELLGRDIPPGSFKRGDWLVSKEGYYFQNQVSFAGKVVREVIDEDREVEIILTGTQNEELLKYASGTKPAVVRVHLCDQHCDRQRVNPDLLHLGKVRKRGEGEARTWEDNLQDTGDTDLLEADHRRWQAENTEKDKEKDKEKKDKEKKEKKEKSSSTSEEKKKKKKKKKKKEKKEKGGAEDPPAGEKKVRRKLGGKQSAKKDLGDLYSMTGMDPLARNRKRLQRKVERRMKKGRSTSSTDNSEESSEESMEKEEALMSDRSKIHQIAQRAPGLLSSLSIGTMRPFVVQSGGNPWDEETDLLPALVSQYAR